MDDLLCPFDRGPMRIKTNADRMPKAPHLHRWWAECGKCGLLTKTFENENRLRVYLANRAPQTTE